MLEADHSSVRSITTPSAIICSALRSLIRWPPTLACLSVFIWLIVIVGITLNSLPLAPSRPPTLRLFIFAFHFSSTATPIFKYTHILRKLLESMPRWWDEGNDKENKKEKSWKKSMFVHLGCFSGTLYRLAILLDLAHITFSTFYCFSIARSSACAGNIYIFLSHPPLGVLDSLQLPPSHGVL